MNEVTNNPKIRADIKKWLIFFRAHTVVLEAPLAILGAGLALGTLVDIEVIKWAIFGTLYHLVGYGMNSYSDWVKGFDKDDPHKQHHPLNTGKIKERTAKIVVMASTIILALYGFIVGGANIVSAGFVIAMFIFGASYNWLGKYTSHKYIPIAISHTLVFVFPLVALGGELNSISLAIISAIFIHNVYQIVVSGDIKDLNQDESSLLKDWGVEISNHPNLGNIITVPNKTIVISMVMVSLETALTIVVIIFTAYFTVQTYPAITILALLSFGGSVYFSMHYHMKMVRSQQYNRKVMVRYMSLKELAGYSAIVLSLAGILEPALLLLLVVSMMIYIRVMSKFMWNSSISPKV